MVITMRQKGTFKKRCKKFYKYRILTLMALPALLYFLINNYLPLAGLFIAFKKVNFRLGLWKSPWVGFENFRYLFATNDAWLITRNTLAYNLVFIILGTVASIFLALLLNELVGKFFPKLYQTSLIIPAMVSMTVVGYAVYAFLSPSYGYLNQLLTALGKEKVNWYLDPKPWPAILVFVNLWKNAGYNSIVYLAAIVGIDPSYYEAAIVDGATREKRIWYITLPMIKPTIISLTLLSVGRIFYADFGLFYQVPLASGALSETTDVIDTYVFKALMMSGDISKSAAAGLYQSVVGFIMVLLANYIVKKVSKEDALF